LEDDTAHVFKVAVIVFWVPALGVPPAWELPTLRLHKDALKSYVLAGFKPMWLPYVATLCVFQFKCPLPCVCKSPLQGH
jgi:hypothetical protein